MTPEDLAALAARAYTHMHPWSARDFAEALQDRFALLTCEDGAFALGRVVVDEAEILALATDPDRQRMGLGARVLAAVEAEARARGAEKMFLEVAAANTPARAFYEAQGYVQVGRRRDYYAKPDGGRDDALLMTKALA